MKEGGAKEFRMTVGYELLRLMERNEDLPLPNINRLSQVMDEYYHRESMGDFVQDEYEDSGWDVSKFKWESSVDYWRSHISDVSIFMRKDHNKYFGYLREDGEFKGNWKFMDKKEWEKALKRNHQDIATRTGNHNEKIDDTLKRWKIDIPRIAEVARLT